MSSVHGELKQNFTAATEIPVTDLASLDALNKVLYVPVPMERFCGRRC